MPNEERSFGKISVTSKPSDLIVQELATGDDLSILFGDGSVECLKFGFNIREDGPIFQTMTVSIVAPWSPRSGVQYRSVKFNLMYGVIKSEGCRVVIVLDVGSQLVTQIFPFGTIEIETNQILVEVPHGNDAQEVRITGMIYVERKSVSDHLIATIDSIDLAAMVQ